MFIGLGIVYSALLFFPAEIVAPILNEVPPGTPPILPMLFVTIACGAVSGFHAIVGSGTSSKQIARETDSRLVGYGGALGEGLLALASLLAVSAGFPDRAAWNSAYSSFDSGGLNGFIQAAAVIVHEGLGLRQDFAVNLLAVMSVLFAGTTMDTGVRLQRYIIQEWGQRFGFGILRKNTVATLLAVVSCLLLAFGAGGTSGRGGMVLWPLFGASNQLLASLTLLSITLYLVHRKKNIWPTFLPMLFLFGMTFVVLLIQAGNFWTAGNYFLFFMDLITFGAAIWGVISAAASVKKLRKSSR